MIPDVHYAKAIFQSQLQTKIRKERRRQDAVQRQWVDLSTSSHLDEAGQLSFGGKLSWGWLQLQLDTGKK